MKGTFSPGPARAGSMLACSLSLLAAELAAQGPSLPPPPPPPASATPPSASAAPPTALAPLPPPPPPPSAERAAPPASTPSPQGWGAPPPWVYPPGSTGAPYPYAPGPAPSPPPPPESRKQPRWYGWQIYLVDGAWMLTGLATSSTDAGKTVGPLASFTYFLGGPIVHWAHGHVGTGFASAGLRVGMPLAGFAVGYGLGSAGSHDDLAAALYGVILGVGGVVAAIIVDAQALARDEIDEPQQASRVRLVPSLSLGNGKGTLGLSGSF